MGPTGDAVLRRDWHTMSLAGRKSAGLAQGPVDVARLMADVYPTFT